MSGLRTIEQGTNARAVARMLATLYPDAWTVLDATYGNGAFWRGSDAEVAVTGMDINPDRARHLAADFTKLPFIDNAFDLVIFDPPYITNPSKSGTSLMGRRFGAYPSIRAMRESVEAGTREAWRVGRLGILVKVQDQIRGGRWIEMTEWVRQAVGQPPYQRIDLLRPAKLMGANWQEQYSALGNGATFLAFRRGSQYHRRRPSVARCVEAVAS